MCKTAQIWTWHEEDNDNRHSITSWKHEQPNKTAVTKAAKEDYETTKNQFNLCASLK